MTAKSKKAEVSEFVTIDGASVKRSALIQRLRGERWEVVEREGGQFLVTVDEPLSGVERAP